jgi:hypothetical protein
MADQPLDVYELVRGILGSDVRAPDRVYAAVMVAIDVECMTRTGHSADPEPIQRIAAWLRGLAAHLLESASARGGRRASEPPRLGPCARHRERACPVCYTVAAAPEDVAQLLAIADDAERIRGLVLRHVVPGAALAPQFRLHPPNVLTLRSILAGLAPALLAGREPGERLEQLASELDARLRAAGS